MPSKTYTITGSAPLILNNGRGADPLDPATKAFKVVSQKRGKSKTDADLSEIDRQEYMMKLYTDEDGHPVIPAPNLESMINAGARQSKDGKKVLAGVFVEADAKIIYDGPTEFEALYADKRFSLRTGFKQGQIRVYKVRPIFKEWSLTFTVTYDNELIDGGQLDKFIAAAGKVSGLGDWRPKFGRFEISNIIENKESVAIAA